MNRTAAIAKKCLECAGSAKEVTLCHTFDCPLWPYRFGKVNMGTKEFNQRMERIKIDYPEDFKYIQKESLEYIQNIKDSRIKRYILRFLGKKPLIPLPIHLLEKDPF